ncbi:MAG: BON domain-containing protein [Planctomycetales bacterium]|nr:BON domain-containing protein [Planctomycetales bacterium]
MRRFLFGVVIASVTAAMPTWALGGDREIAKAIMTELQQHKAAGTLKGFDIDLKVEEGIVYLTGKVASDEQLRLVQGSAVKAAGETNIVNELKVEGRKPAAPAVDATVATASALQVPQHPAITDAAITDNIIVELQNSKTSGLLRGFELDVSTVNGDVWLRGQVSDQSQKDLVLDVARRTQGVSRVVDDISVVRQAVLPASTLEMEPAIISPQPVPQAVPEMAPQVVPQAVQQVSSMPVVGAPQAPRPIASAGLASVQMNPTGAPQPIQATGVAYGMGAPRYDQPSMPNYAWPSYAAYPNYGAVTYPKQYSPSAWPYIGPFYPYPQVPLGWRKVALQWDDGLWYLDFSSK